MTIKSSVDGRLEAVFQKVFGVNEVTEETSIDRIPQWDSLAHIGLILAIESEFHIQISPEQAIEMISVRAIRDILQEQGAS